MKEVMIIERKGAPKYGGDPQSSKVILFLLFFM